MCLISGNQTAGRLFIAFIFVFFSINAFAQGLQERDISLQGRIVNYNPTVEGKTLRFISNPLEDQMVQQVVNIKTDGTFKFKSSIAYSQEVTMLYHNRKYSLLFSPGDSLQLIVDTAVVIKNDQRLLDDSIHYQLLLNEMQAPDKLRKYDMNDNLAISAKHSEFVYKLYRKVTNNFSPDSAILFKKLAGERDIIGMVKLIIWNIQHQSTGFTRDVFFTRLFLDALNGHQLKEFDAVWKEKLITDPWFVSKIKKRRTEIEQYLINQKTGTNAIVVTDNQGPSGFDGLIKKHAGKVIYVDFWAPWCSPCMAAMPASKIVQEHFKEKDVVFLFLANRCSDESWKATIANKNLTGIHLNLTDDEYNVLAERFKIVGIPHYLIIDKQGKVVSPNAPGPDTTKTLISELERVHDLKVK